MDKLDYLESKSIYIIREAYAKHRNIALLWSIGKDSTTLLWLCKKAFLGKIPFPVLHIDTSFKFPEIYEFRDKYAKGFNLNLIIAKNEKALSEGMSCKCKFDCCNALKTQALKDAIAKYNFKALILGIRRDEHGIRGKERYFSPRNESFRWNYENQPLELWNAYATKANNEGHTRVHPLLHWSELDIWEYTAREKIPVVPLYFAKKGKRYRSIGCKPCCTPVKSDASNINEIIKELRESKVSERSGRVQDKESHSTMQKLRSLGYM